MTIFYMQVNIPVNSETVNDLDRLVNVLQAAKVLGATLETFNIVPDHVNRRYIVGIPVPENGMREEFNQPLTEERFFEVAKEF